MHLRGEWMILVISLIPIINRVRVLRHTVTLIVDCEEVVRDCYHERVIFRYNSRANGEADRVGRIYGGICR